MSLRLAALNQQLNQKPPITATGRVVGVQGQVILAKIPRAAMGDLCCIQKRNGEKMLAQVLSFKEEFIFLAPFDELEGVSPGASVVNTGKTPEIRLPNHCLGKILDALGNPIAVPDKALDQQEPRSNTTLNLSKPSPNPLERKKIDSLLATGIQTIDGLCSIGYGQRLGLFSCAGAGKSTLLGMIARNAEVDVSVIALVGERGREVNEFISNCLGAAGLKKSVVIVSTSNESPLKRRLAPMTATAIAEYFRDQGKRVLLLVDSLTRTARAIREVSLAVGELPVRQGYTSSVYTELPRLLERAGNNHCGSITAIYTVLTTGGNELDPLGEEVKSILDGHIILDPSLAEQGIRPAIDPTSSISRLLPALHNEQHLEVIQTIIKILARLKRDKDILLFGGTPDCELQAALSVEKDLHALMTQHPEQKGDPAATLQEFSKIAGRYQLLCHSASLSD